MLEAGPVSPKTKGTTRLTLQTTGGLDYDGGHLERHGVSPAGEVVDVPLHEHRVSLDFARLELSYERTFRENWDVWVRLPYEIKRRRASIVELAPATPEERAAIERNLAIHHPTRTLEGLSDARVLVARRLVGAGRAGAALDLAVGTTLPTGRTEGDPFVAGDAGLEHEHVQFGSGTFDPVLEAYYSAPLGPRWLVGGFFTGRIPFYDNDKTYRGSPEVNAGVSTLRRIGGRLSIQANLAGYYQDFAHWDGARDVNSGLRSLSGMLSATVALRGGVQLDVGLRLPIAQQTLLDGGDGFEPGPTVLVRASHTFGAQRSGPAEHRHGPAPDEHEHPAGAEDREGPESR